MEIIEGKYSGFCNGVNYTVNKALELLDEYGRIYCLGELVHNEIIISELENKGMITVNNLFDVPVGSKVIFRAHGEGKKVYEQAEKLNLEVFDLTCGKVKLVHKKIEKHGDSFVIIVGKNNHPEVIGHTGYCNNYVVVQDDNDLVGIRDKFISSNLSEIYVVAQTTYNILEFERVVEKIKKIFDKYLVIVDNTICSATNDRSNEVVELSKMVDYMIIVGGKNSSNTKELYELAKDNCNTILIQNVDDLTNIDFSGHSKIGLMGGASTPRSILDEIKKYLKK